MNRKRQYSSVVITVTTREYCDGRGTVMVEKDYFDVVEEIIELYYFQNNKVALFKCVMVTHRF